ncbi:thioredoxin [Mesonia sp. HuA40]|uniref:thioredoxin n=1 Tax=Mesonia sp. HuA40 TaxID=2602761 RepID=UPI0011CB0E82|nr:thioredoxin [Mesonia sp. HuA40]TXK74214.1 thioredoxin [Mesonia sp. HuA40]
MKTNFNSLLQGKQLVLVDFYATWCGPCKALNSILQEVKKEVGEAVKIIKIDVDKNQNLAQKFQVRGVPILILFKNAQPVWRQSGVVPANDLKQLIQSNS